MNTKNHLIAFSPPPLAKETTHANLYMTMSQNIVAKTGGKFKCKERNDCGFRVILWMFVWQWVHIHTMLFIVSVFVFSFVFYIWRTIIKIDGCVFGAFWIWPNVI